MAVAYAQLPTSRKEGRAPAVRRYEAMCREMGDVPWPDDVEKLAQQVEGFAVTLCERGLAPPTARRYSGGVSFGEGVSEASMRTWQRWRRIFPTRLSAHGLSMTRCCRRSCDTLGPSQRRGTRTQLCGGPYFC